MEDGITRKNEDIDLELSDAIAAIDDLKINFKTAEESIVNNTNENFEVSFHKAIHFHYLKPKISLL